MKTMRYQKIVAGGAVLATTMLLAVSAQAAEEPVAVAPGQSESVETVVADNDMRVAVRIGAGYLRGESNEYVYVPAMNDYTLSKLTWDIDSMLMVGIGGSVAVCDWLTINADGWFKASDGDGSMDDYDWLVPGLDWTDWSTHDDTDVTAGSVIDINVEIPFHQTEQMTFSAYVGYRRDNFEWEARGGSFIYSMSGFRDTQGTIPAGLLGITYEQTFDVPYLGVGMHGDFDGWQLDGRLIFSPFVSGETEDTHHLRNLHIIDDFSGESMMAFDIAASYALRADTLLKLGFSYVSYDTMQGDSEYQNAASGAVINTQTDGGADHDATMLSLSLVYRF